MPQAKQVPFDELVAREAKSIATDILERELSKLDLPLPKESSLEIHIGALLSQKPQITMIAKQRVEARQDAYSESLKTIGIEIIPTTAADLIVDIDL